MVYLKKFTLLDEIQEHNIEFNEERRNIFNNYYPLHLFSSKSFKEINFDKITIFYGGNGSGKTTLINMISQKLNASRKSPIDKGSYFDLYVDHCDYEMSFEQPMEIKLITSDDVFDYMLNIRTLNQGIDQKRENLFEEYLNTKYATFKFQSLEDYEQLKKVCETRSKTQSKYVRNHLNNNIRTYSNGESAYQYFTEKILDGGLYLLDEPENSLSPQKQLELLQFLEDSVRFYDCQFIIATHSPFLLSLKGARIYDMDAEVVDIKPWTKLKNVREYYNFFKQYEEEFDKK